MLHFQLISCRSFPAFLASIDSYTSPRLISESKSKRGKLTLSQLPALPFGVDRVRRACRFELRHENIAPGMLNHYTIPPHIGRQVLLCTSSWCRLETCSLGREQGQAERQSVDHEGCRPLGELRFADTYCAGLRSTCCPLPFVFLRFSYRVFP